MSIKRINSTGRKKILREDVQIIVRPDDDGVLTFDATLDLAEYGLPDDGQVFVEAYRQTTFMRFEHGTAALPQAPRHVSRRLTGFATADALQFRVKVTSAGDRPGVLLAEADQIKPRDDDEQPDDRIPLLPPAPCDLGQETWRVGFGESTSPLLLVNSRLGDWKSVAASPLFRSLVYPAAMRQVLTRIVVVEDMDERDDPTSWQCRWLAFTAGLGVGEPPAPDADDGTKLDWIDDAVESFARQHQMLNYFRAFLDTEASS